MTLSPWIRTFPQHALQRFLLTVPKLAMATHISSRVIQVLRVWNYLYTAKIHGDYLEFGVYQGLSFKLAMDAAAKTYPKGSCFSPRFFAFDSFEGLPDPDATHDAGVFSKGEYRCDIEKFQRNIQRAAKRWQVKIIPGYFDKSLTPFILENHKIESAAFVTIDCDLYSSTVPVLKFITPIVKTGTVLFFDDWYSSGGDMTLGEAGACQHWLSDNPNLSLIDFGNVGIHGKLFIVNRRPSTDMKTSSK